MKEQIVQTGQGEPRRRRLEAAVLGILLLIGLMLTPFTGRFLPMSGPAALAEEDEEGGSDEDDYNYDLETIPFRLVNTEGKAPGLDRESEWKLELKPEWEDQDIPNRVTAVTAFLLCYDLDWKDNLSIVWKKEYKGLPEQIICTGLKIGGRYMLTARVYYDDDWIEVSAGFIAEGGGKELIMNVITQAAAECRTTDEWKTALNLYNWLLNHQVYDETLSYYSSDAILRDTGVCDSYSRLYFLLCKAAGLDAYVVYGETTVGYHAWDAVRINGEWYYVDPTWDDHPKNDPAMSKETAPDGNNVRYGVYDYRYFMLNKQLMTIGHHKTYEWLDEGKCSQAEQPANSLEANYYIHTGLWKQWGLRDGDHFRTITDLIRDELSGGGKMWSTETLMDKGLSTYGSDAPAFRLSEYETHLLAYALKGSALTLADGSTVTLDTYVYKESRTSGLILNVYPEGGFVTDEAGKLTLPASLTRIEAQAFEGDCRIGEVICPAGLVSIGARAFAGCSRLWYIRIPSDVESIAEDAFEGCHSELRIWTEHRDSLPARYATEHGITLYVGDEEEGSNG